MLCEEVRREASTLFTHSTLFEKLRHIRYNTWNYEH